MTYLRFMHFHMWDTTNNHTDSFGIKKFLDGIIVKFAKIIGWPFFWGGGGGGEVNMLAFSPSAHLHYG